MRGGGTVAANRGVSVFWFFYNVLFTIGYVLMLPKFLLRMARRGGYGRRFGERFGRYEPDVLARLQERRRIWVHAVSVGEMYVALRFLRALREQRPDASFILSTVTSTGRAVAERSVDPRDVVVYFPVDFPWAVRRVLRTVQPRAMVFTETELWPNMLRLARDGGVRTAVINGRLSDRSYRGYRRIRPFFRRAAGCLDLVCVQSETDRQRFADLGVLPERIEVLGSAKYDVAEYDPTGEAKAGEVLAAAGMGRETPILLGGSTWPGEEAVLLDVFCRLRADFPALRLVLVPRHAERAGDVAAEIARRKLAFVRRKELAAGLPAKPPDVLLVDTTGELKHFYACATVIFVGKSLTQHGGQNIIEPALFGKPIITGPHLENFADIAADFCAAGALAQVQDGAELEAQVRRLLGDEALRRQQGQRAAALVQQKKGTIHATAARIDRL